MKIPVLQTARLELRPLTLDDLDDVASMLGDAEALRLWADGFGRRAVILRATRELVGDCGLITPTVEGRREIEPAGSVRRAL